MLLVGSFPFNSFLAGLFCSVGFFVLTGALWAIDPLLLLPRSPALASVVLDGHSLFWSLLCMVFAVHILTDALVAL